MQALKFFIFLTTSRKSAPKYLGKIFTECSDVDCRLSRFGFKPSLLTTIMLSVYTGAYISCTCHHCNACSSSAILRSAFVGLHMDLVLLLNGILMAVFAT